MGMNSITEAVKTFNDLAVKPLLAVAVASGLLVFAPAPIVAKLGMDKFVTDYRSWLGLALVISCAYLFAHAVDFLAKHVRNKFRSSAIRKTQIEYLKGLAPDEKSRIAPYIADQKSSDCLRDHGWCGARARCQRNSFPFLQCGRRD